MRLPLRFSGPMVVALPVLLAAVAVSLVAFTQGRAAVNQLTDRNLGQMHGRITDHIDYLLALPVQAVRINLGLMSDGRLSADNLGDWARPLFDQAHALPRLSSISWERSDGQVVWMARYPGSDQIVYGVKDRHSGSQLREYEYDAAGRLPAEPFRSFEYDPRDWAPYQLAAGRSDPAWCEPVEWIDDEGRTVAWAIAYVAPWRDPSGVFRGAVTSQLTLDNVSRFLARLPLSQRMLTYVVDRQGRLLADSARSTGGSVGPLTPAWEAPQPVIAASARQLGPDLERFLSGSARVSEAVLLGEEPYLIRVTPFRHQTGLEWLIVTLVPQREFMAEIEAGRRLGLLVGLLVVAVTLLAGVLLAVRLFRPTIILSQHVRRIGQGDFDSRLNLTLSPEFVEMSEAINQMCVDLKDHLRMRQSLALATEVQRHLLPLSTPAVEGVEIAARSVSCDETGGDYYDFLQIGPAPGCVTAAVGDVMGHGVPAAMLMATARGILRSRGETPDTLADLLTHLNRLLTEVTGNQRFMTMLLLALDSARRELRWASAGHGTPLVFDPRTGGFLDLEGGGIPLGIEADTRYAEQLQTGLRPGMVVLAATDGLWEMLGQGGEQFGLGRVLEVLRIHAARSAEQIAQAMEQALDAFRGEEEQRDDVTFVVLKLTGWV